MVELVDTKKIMEMTADCIMHTINRLPVVFVRGEGAYLTDADGRKYLDFLAGIAVNGLGHCHPKLVSAIQKQAAELMHVSNLYHISQQAELAKKLTGISGMGKAFFANSGGEANEAAIKLARKWTKENVSPEKYEIISTLGSFHGRTLATVAATGQPKYHQGFEPMPAGFKHVPYNDLDAMKDAVTDETCAILVEPVQGESGVWPASMEYMQGIRKLCDEKGLLLILDEVQTGLGRTGKWFGFEHYGIGPDIMTLAKTLGGGFPIGVCLATNEVAKGFKPSSHNSTFGGNPLGCAASLAALEIIENEGLIENARKMGEYLRKKLEIIKEERSDVTEIRSMGLMVAMQTNREDAADVSIKCMENGLLVGVVGQNTIRFLPPLIISEEHVDEAVRIINKSL